MMDVDRECVLVLVDVNHTFVHCRAALQSHLERVSLDVADLQKDFSELEDWFVDEVTEAKQIMEKMEQLVEVGIALIASEECALIVYGHVD